MRDTGKVVLTFFGSIVFCSAVIGTIQSLRDGGAGNGPALGGIIIGLGLAMLIIPWLPDDAARAQPTQSKSRRMTAA